MAHRSVGLVTVLLLAAGCGTELVRVVPLSVPAERRPGSALEVSARSSSALDPLPVSGSRVAYGDVENALLQAVTATTVPFLERHAASGPRAFTLSAEIVHGEAEWSRGRLAVALVVRATLRARAGNAFVAQTNAVCRVAEFVDPEKGAPVVYRCLERVGSSLEGWLEATLP